MMNLEVGDIFLSHEVGSPVSQFISVLTKSYWTHAAMYVGDGKIIESIRYGVVLTDLSKELPKIDFVVLRYPYLTSAQKESLPHIAFSFLGKSFDYGMGLNVIKNFVRPSGFYVKPDNATLCSNLVIDIYKKLGITLCPQKNPKPQDIWNSMALERAY